MILYSVKLPYDSFSLNEFEWDKAHFVADRISFRLNTNLDTNPVLFIDTVCIYQNINNMRGTCLSFVHGTEKDLIN